MRYKPVLGVILFGLGLFLVISNMPLWLFLILIGFGAMVLGYGFIKLGV